MARYRASRPGTAAPPAAKSSRPRRSRLLLGHAQSLSAARFAAVISRRLTSWSAPPVRDDRPEYARPHSKSPWRGQWPVAARNWATGPRGRDHGTATERSSRDPRHVETAPEDPEREHHRQQRAPQRRHLQDGSASGTISAAALGSTGRNPRTSRVIPRTVDPIAVSSRPGTVTNQPSVKNRLSRSVVHCVQYPGRRRRRRRQYPSREPPGQRSNPKGGSPEDGRARRA